MKEKAKIKFNARINDIKSTCENIETLGHLTKSEIMQKIINYAQSFIDAKKNNFEGND